MFNLYVYDDGWKKKPFQDKKEVINEMINFSNLKKIYHFLIVEETAQGPITETTLVEEDFLEYIKNFKETLKEEKKKEKIKKYSDMSCVELKRAILKAKGYFD